MPRAGKQVQSHKYDRPYLEALKRKSLQALARKEGIKANIKSEEMISLLLKGDGQSNVDERHSRSNSVTSEKESVEKSKPIDPPCSNAANERTGSEKTHANKDGDMPYDPLTDREVRDIRRRLKQWNDEIVSSQKHVKDVGEVLSFAERIVSDVGREVEGMIKYRIACEERVVRRLHVDRHIWDGTRRLPALKRAKWQAFVKEDERKKELERARRRNDADNSDSGSECSVEL